MSKYPAAFFTGKLCYLVFKNEVVAMEKPPPLGASPRWLKMGFFELFLSATRLSAFCAFRERHSNDKPAIRIRTFINQFSNGGNKIGIKIADLIGIF